MAPGPQTLFGLFGDFVSGWPSAHVRPETGNVAGGDEPDPAPWLLALNQAVHVLAVRGGARADGVAVEAELSLPATGFPSFPDGWPFVLTSMPDVEFRIKPFALAGRVVRMVAALGAEGGPELVLEGLPVEIVLPSGLIEVHPDEPGDPAGNATVTVGEFEPGRLDDLQVVYRRGGGPGTSVLVHVRLTMTADLEFDIQPAVPISFGRCALSGVPCTAVHDFRLLPSPGFARDRIEWLRHSIEPWLPSHTASNDGLFAVRSADIDEESSRLRGLADWLNDHQEDETPAPGSGSTPDPGPAAEFVFGDAVVPFRGPLLLPVPRHLTAGVRRRVLDPASTEQVFAFERAPVRIRISSDPHLTFVVQDLYYRSQPSEQIGEDLGLTFHAALVFGADSTAQHAIEIGLEPEYTLTAAYQRDFATPPNSPPGTPPEPSDGPHEDVNRLGHFEIAQILIFDVMAIRGGFSLGRWLGQGKDPVDSWLLTADLFVSLPPTGADDHKGFRLRALNGEHVTFTLENAGWRFGEIHLEGIALPDGVVAWFGPLGFVISELGLTAEDDASYLSLSGGLVIDPPAGLEGALTVKRLRLRVRGNESAPRLKIDGFFLRLKSSVLLIEAGGYYSEREESDTSITEFGFTGTVSFHVGKVEHRVMVDLLHGHRSSDAGSFHYLMVQAVYAGQLGPIAGVELRGARVLYANNMKPKLREVDRDARELRYYRWYLDSDPLTVPGDRRLAAWEVIDDAWAWGVGASASFVALGRLVVLDLFVLGIHSPAEHGMLFSARVFAIAPEPLGFLAIEWDRENDRTSAVLAVNVTMASFVKDAPGWLAGAGGLKGSLFLSNDPATLAIGRLADQSSWLTLRFGVDLWLEASLSIAFCLELVEGGPKGFALAVRVEGGIGKRGVIQLSYNAGFGVQVLVFTTGSTDYAAMVFIEVGFRFILFGFLRIGVSARLEFRVVGAAPTRGDLSAQIRLETPWFLPDVTWRLEVQFGELDPAALSAAAQPLASSAAIEAASLQRLPAHLERFDPHWDGTGVSPTHSVRELQAPTRPEAVRLANLAADTALRPVATDATIAVEWSVPVIDRLGLGTGLASDPGRQQSGDLTLTYELVGLAVRRRARFGADRSWHQLSDRIELTTDFSDPGGVQLQGAFAEQVLAATWDLDQQVAGQPAAKRLLLNGVAPYEFATSDARSDEQLVRFATGWPCCRPPDDKDLADLFHRVHWRDALAGVDLPARSRFSDSTSSIRFPRGGWTHPAQFAGAPAGTMVAVTPIASPGVAARADLDQDAAFCGARLAWPRGVQALLVMFDRTGREVGRRDLGAGTAAFQSVLAGAQGPIRRFEVWILPRTPGIAHPVAGARRAASVTPVTLEIEEASYVGLDDYLELLLEAAACEAGAGGGYEGKGKLALLPNHEYEIRLTTRASIGHPSTATEPADVEEFVYVRTKGLPGLNAVTRLGDELEPHVRQAYSGGTANGALYRAEPVTLAFSEGFLVAVPLNVRPPGTAAEQTTLLRMQLVAEPEVASGAETVFTTTGEDWVATHHGAGVPPPPPRPRPPWRGKPAQGTTTSTAMVTADPLLHRLARVTQRPGVPCSPGDPRELIGTVLIAPPPGEDGQWSASTRFVASVRVEGAGFVDRRPFEPGDDTAFSRFPATGAWSIADDGSLQTTAAGNAVFGDPDWDHLTAAVGMRSASPGQPMAPAGVGFGVSGTGPAPRGIFVTVDGGRLVIRRRTTVGGPLTELAAAVLPVPADPADVPPVTLLATAYDDRVKAQVGEVVVEADRDVVREGRLCLVAGGPVAFTSLQVHGLDLFAFGFTVSRFGSFEDHIGSWSGRLDDAAPDVMGPGTTTATVAQLWAAGAGDVSAVMAPGAMAADRERVFAAWAGALGLPLKDDVTSLELTRVTDSIGRAQALLIESPEPLDLTSEITAGMVHRTHTGGLPFPVQPLPPSTVAGSLRDRLHDLVQPASPGPRPRGPLHVRAPRPDPDRTILDVDVVRGGLRLTLDPALANAGALAVVAVGQGGDLRLLGGVVRPGFLPQSPAQLLARRTGAMPALPHGSELAPDLASPLPGTVLLATTDLVQLVGRFRMQPEDVDVPVPVQALQSGDGRRVLLIPTAAAHFEPGSHRLTLTLSRRRWPTTDAPDATNTYQATATISLNF